MSFFNTDHLAAAVSTGSAGILALSFVAGVASSLTPCIYPLIPVTISILGSKQAESRLKGFLLTLSYVIGIAVTYAALGVVAAFTGSLFGSVSSNPYVLIGVGVLIMALALNMLDVYSIPMFGLSLGTANAKRPSYLANFAYGLTFGLVASPCTAPPLAVLLTWVGSTRNLVLGPLALFCFALGMGGVLVVIGTFSAFLGRLPRSGGWMVGVKKSMGLLMIVMAGYFIFQAGTQW